MGKSKFDNDFQERMENHLIKFKETRQYLPTKSKKSWMYADLADNLFPPIRHGFLQHIYDSATPLHDYANHVRSSQAYCVNIFYYLLQNEPEKLMAFLCNKLSLQSCRLEEYEFEYSPETNVLGEWKSDINRPEEYVTAVDLLLLTKDPKTAILIEVKFTESGFTECGGYNSGGNAKDSRSACEQGRLLLDDYTLCYLHGCHGKSRLKRKYFDLLDLNQAFLHSAFQGQCPFIANHQCLRNHALMNHFRSEGYEGRLCLVHHEANHSIIEAWDRYTGIIAEPLKKQLFRLSGKEIINSVGDEFIKAYYKDRYCMNE